MAFFAIPLPPLMFLPNAKGAVTFSSYQTGLARSKPFRERCAQVSFPAIPASNELQKKCDAMGRVTLVRLQKGGLSWGLVNVFSDFQWQRFWRG
jgi:hypothetical protein